MMKHSWKAGTCCALLFATWQMIPALAEEITVDEVADSVVSGGLAAVIEQATSESEVSEGSNVVEDGVNADTATETESVVATEATEEAVEASAEAEEDLTIPTLDLDGKEEVAKTEETAEDVTAIPDIAKLGLDEENKQALDVPGDVEVAPEQKDADTIDSVLKRNQLLRAKKSLADGKKARERLSFADAEAAFKSSQDILKREFPGDDQIAEVAELLQQLEFENNLNLEQWAARLTLEANHERNANKIKEAIDKLRGLITYYKSDFENDKVLEIEGQIKSLETQADEIELGNILKTTENAADEAVRSQDKLYSEARYNYTLNRLDIAREKANQMLLANPYETRALQLLGKISDKQRQVGFLASEMRRMDMVTQTIWNWVNTLPPSIEDFQDDDGGDIVDLDVDTQAIRAKLRDIRVDKDNEIKANFSIGQICSLLEDLSKSLDETGTGIKFISVDYEKSDRSTSSSATASENVAGDMGLEDDLIDDGAEDMGGADSGSPSEQIAFEDREIYTPLNLKGLSIGFILDQIVKLYAGRVAYEIDQHTVIFYDPKFKPIELEERTWLVAANLFGSLNDESDSGDWGGGDEENEFEVGGGAVAGGSGETYIYTNIIGQFFEKQGVYFSKDGRYYHNASAVADGEEGEEVSTSSDSGLWEDKYRPGLRAHVSYNKNTGVLRMVNTKDMLDKADELVNTRVIRDLVKVEAKFVEVEQTNDEILAFKWQIANGLINYNPTNHSTGGDSLTGSRLDGDGNPTNNAATGTLANNGKGQSIGLGSAMNNITSGLRDFLEKEDGTSVTANPLLDVWGVFGGTAINMVMSAVSQSEEKNILFAPQVTTRSGTWARLSTQTLRHFIEVSYDGSSSTSTDNNGNARDTEGGLQLETWSFLEGVDLWINPGVQSDRYTIDLDLIPDVTLLQGWDYLQTRNRAGDPFIVPGENGQDSTIDIEIKRPILSVRRITGGKGTGFRRGGGIIQPAAGGNAEETASLKILDPLGAGESKTQTINYADSEGVSVAIWDGESVVLGGLINERIDKFQDKVPYLGDIPFVGRLFQSKGETSKKFNLMIFVTARIVNPAGVPIRQHQARGLPDFSR